jgi:hypothetical protein
MSVDRLFPGLLLENAPAWREAGRNFGGGRPAAASSAEWITESAGVVSVWSGRTVSVWPGLAVSCRRTVKAAPV